MGRGNVCTTGPYEWVFYIDNDYTAVYRKVSLGRSLMPRTCDGMTLRRTAAPTLRGQMV